MSDVLRILIVDDHMIVRTGLSQLLGSFAIFDVVAEAESGEEALYLYMRHRPDVVLMDVRMAGMDGTSAAAALRQSHPDACIVALSTFADDGTVRQMLAAGARGFLAKTISSDLLAEAILRVARGERLVFQSDALIVAETIETSSPEPVSSDEELMVIGRQQRRILALLSKGFSNAQIGEYLGISVATVRYHVSAILQKLGVTNRAEAVATGIRHNLFDDHDF